MVWNLKQIGKVKKLNKWMAHKLIKKKIVLKCHLLLLYTNTMNHFLIGWWHAVKSGFYKTIGDNLLSGWTKRFQTLPKARFIPKQVMVSLVVCCLSDPLYLSASQQNHYIWEVCSANWWDAPNTAMPAASIGQQKGSNSSPGQCLTARLSHNQCFRSWTNWATQFCFICQVLLTTH